MVSDGSSRIKDRHECKFVSALKNRQILDVLRPQKSKIFDAEKHFVFRGAQKFIFLAFKRYASVIAVRPGDICLLVIQ